MTQDYAGAPINIQYLRNKGVVETESEALGLLSKDRITKKGHPVNLKKLSVIFKKHMKKKYPMFIFYIR